MKVPTMVVYHRDRPDHPVTINQDDYDEKIHLLRAKKEKPAPVMPEHIQAKAEKLGVDADLVPKTKAQLKSLAKREFGVTLDPRKSEKTMAEDITLLRQKKVEADALAEAEANSKVMAGGDDQSGGDE